MAGLAPPEGQGPRSTAQAEGLWEPSGELQPPSRQGVSCQRLGEAGWEPCLIAWEAGCKRGHLP